MQNYNNPLLQNQQQAQQSQVPNSQQALFDALDKSAPQLAQMKQSMQGVNNPMELLNKMGMQNNPMLSSLMSGQSSPEQLVRNMCQQQGIDVNAFMSKLNGIK